MTDTYKLYVAVPDERTFNAYWYGNGVVIGVGAIDETNFGVVVDYGTDKYRADYQCGRFLSGLYRCEVLPSTVSEPEWF